MKFSWKLIDNLCQHFLRCKFQLRCHISGSCFRSNIFFFLYCWTVPECYTMVAESKFQVAWHSILWTLSSLYYYCEQGFRTQSQAAIVTLWSSLIHLGGVRMSCTQSPKTESHPRFSWLGRVGPSCTKILMQLSHVGPGWCSKAPLSFYGETMPAHT